MSYKLPLTGLCIMASILSFSQNVAINSDGSSPDASAALHIKSSNRGLLMPTLTSAERSAIASPAKGLIVYQTTSPEGFYYNSGTPSVPVWTFINAAAFNTAWLIGGNSVSGPVSFGTTNANHIDFITGGVVRGRLSNLGEFFIGTTNTPLPGDLMNGVGNVTFPWAVNGYTSFNGGGVYGAIQGANTTAFAAVQGENNSTTGGINSSAVRGINSSMTAGTGFRTQAATGPRMGVTGMVTQLGSYSFGVYGSSPSTSTRTGGLFGDDGGIAMGAVAYYAQNTLMDYSFYGFGYMETPGVVTGRGPSTTVNTHVGLGIYGGVMGGWIRGQVYGAHIKGERYSLYVDGQTFTNQPITQLVETEKGDRLPTYTPAALKTDVTTRGRSALEAGSKYIAFDKSFKEIISTVPEEMTVTVTPRGNSNGVYVTSVDANGFWVKENNNGNSNVSFNWIAIGTRKGYEQPEIATELLEKDFDKKMNNVMSSELDTKAPVQPMWWDGKNVRFDTPPPRQPAKDTFTGQRPTTPEKE